VVVVEVELVLVLLPEPELLLPQAVNPVTKIRLAKARLNFFIKAFFC
jgi:hypothetical protein